MMARSGSTEGRSGSEISPAPSCLRVECDVEWLVRREVALARTIGEEPVPVVIGADDAEWAEAEECDDVTDAAAAPLTAACPQRLQ
jgi:hypothetical protein